MRKLHDNSDHVLVEKKTQKLADEATMPYEIVSCCEIDKQSTGFF